MNTEIFVLNFFVLLSNSCRTVTVFASGLILWKYMKNFSDVYRNLEISVMFITSRIKNIESSCIS